MRRRELKGKNPPKDFTGLWVYECPTGIIYESEYLRGVEHGAYRHKLPSGVTIREGTKKNGLDHGKITVRDSNGNILGSYNFENGTGTHYIYNTLGALGWEVPYLEGKQHGIKRHYINSKVVSEQEYCNGQKI